MLAAAHGLHCLQPHTKQAEQRLRVSCAERLKRADRIDHIKREINGV